MTNKFKREKGLNSYKELAGENLWALVSGNSNTWGGRDLASVDLGWRSEAKDMYHSVTQSLDIVFFHWNFHYEGLPSRFSIF